MTQSPQLNEPPGRVVSLVPSLTESLFDLGAGERLVGITDFCIHPEAGVARLPRVGGPKNPRIEDILRLRPDLVLANREENTKECVEALQSEGIPVWVPFPNTVMETLRMLADLVEILQVPGAKTVLADLESAVRAQAARIGNRKRYFCPIWQGQEPGAAAWWMTFNGKTYSADLLRLCGGENTFAGRDRRYPLRADLSSTMAEPPGGRDTRYPRVPLPEITAGAPEVILLPSEPYAYQEEHRSAFLDLFSDTPAGKTGQMLLVDGTLITWNGTRLGKAIRELPDILSSTPGPLQSE